MFLASVPDVQRRNQGWLSSPLSVEWSGSIGWLVCREAGRIGSRCVTPLNLEEPLVQVYVSPDDFFSDDGQGNKQVAHLSHQDATVLGTDANP